MGTSRWAFRAWMVRDIVGYVARSPRRLAEVGWWLRHRRRTTIDSWIPWLPRVAVEAVGGAGDADDSPAATVLHPRTHALLGAEHHERDRRSLLAVGRPVR